MKLVFGPASLMRCALLRFTAASAMAESPTCTRNIHIIEKTPNPCQVNTSKDLLLLEVRSQRSEVRFCR